MVGCAVRSFPVLLRLLGVLLTVWLLSVSVFLNVAGRECTAFSEAEKAALDFALAASQVPNTVNADIKKELHKHKVQQM